ncbi:MAG TPA: PQQ-binding-like beta-propeller repeat protein, partial [Fimbriimonadaceae bacterium]|nr:PQQ-binding-like beta-propeller repeat protein [Fimbriimonadaceae bacterium]
MLAAASMAMADFDGPAPLAWRWIQPTSATVTGSPLVVGDTVYVAVGQRTFALDKATGNQKWRYPLIEPIPGYFIGSPVLINGTLIVTGDNRKVYGVDPETGQEKWTYTAVQPIIGPAVAAGKFAVISESDNTIMAIDPATGTAAWKDDNSRTELPVKMINGITGPLVGSGDDVLVMDDAQELVAVSTITRKPSWTQKFSTLDSSSRPLVMGDLIIINSGQYLAAIRAASGRAAWQIPMGANLSVGPAVSGDGIFVVDEDGNANFYDLGGHRITKKAIAIGSYPIVRPAVAGKLFVVPTTNGAINLVDPMTGKVSWSYLIRPIGVQYSDKPKSGTGPGSGGGGKGGGGFGGGGGLAGGGQSGSQNQTPDRIWTIQAAGTPVVSG